MKLTLLALIFLYLGLIAEVDLRPVVAVVMAIWLASERVVRRAS